MDLGLQAKRVSIIGGTRRIGRAIVDGAITTRVQY